MKIKWQRFLVMSLVPLLGISIVSCAYPTSKEFDINEFAIPEGDAEVEKWGEYAYLGSENAPWWMSYYKDGVFIRTWRESTVTMELGKGEKFEAIVAIEKAEDRNNDSTMETYPGGVLLFYVEGPNNQKILDAGRIEGVPGFFYHYGFSFTAPTTGEYRFYFISRKGEGYCFVKMKYSPWVMSVVR